MRRLAQSCRPEPRRLGSWATAVDGLRRLALLIRTSWAMKPCPWLVAAAAGCDVSGADLGHLLDAGRGGVERNAAGRITKPDATGLGDRMHEVAQPGDPRPGRREQERQRVCARD